MLTYEGPDEADNVLREIEEREVVESPGLWPEPLRRPEPPEKRNKEELSPRILSVANAIGDWKEG